MFLGIDIGTSGVKTLLIDAEQQIIASARSPLSATKPHSGWSEQSPTDWIEATSNTLDMLKDSHPKALSAVQGIALSGHMHGATLIDKHDKVLRPCMLWNDTRSHQEAKALDENPLFRDLSGNIVFPGFTAPKVSWVKNHEPDIFNKIHKVLLPKDYIRLWLSGEYVSDMSDASGTSWLDIGRRAWSEDLLAASDMSIEQMPSLAEGTEVTGYLRNELRQRWGINQAPVIAGGAGDNAASACGMGTIQAGSAFVSLGTSGVLFAANDSYLPNPASAVHAFCHAVPKTWHQMGVILSATDSLNWYSKVSGVSAADLTAALGKQLNRPSGVTFLPFLAGERTPHNDPEIRGAFIGLGHNSTQQTLTQAVLEGVAFAIQDNLSALESAGTHLQRITAVGGGSQSIYWLKSLATALNLPIDVPADGDFGGAYGAARLALISAHNLDPLDVCITPKTQHTIEPEPSLSEAYQEAYATYQALYPALKGAKG